jgi:hypothetical protein
MNEKIKMKVSIEFETTDNSGNKITKWYNEYCHDLEYIFLMQKLNGQNNAYLFNWDAIVKRHYNEFKNHLDYYEVFE